MAFADSDWRILPFKSKSSTKGKATRKRIELNLQNNDYFPPEGHCCIKLKSNDSESTFLYFGGARRVQETEWKFGHDLFHMTFNHDPDDAYISSIQRFDNIMGAHFLSLQSASAWYDTRTVFVWGGLNTDTFETSNELIKLDFIRNKYQCTICQPAGKTSLSKLVQNGDIPVGRTGHTVTQLSENVIVMHGGLSLPNRHKPGLASPFSQVCNDGSFYEFDSRTLRWTKIRDIPDVMPRAYHTANIATISGTRCVIIIGGVSFKGVESSPSERLRLPLSELVILKLHGVAERRYSLDKISASIPEDIFISYQSVVSFNNILYITGGFVQKEAEITDPPTASNKLYAIDLQSLSIESTELDIMYCTAGNSSFTLSDDCIMVVGGVLETIFAYTTKPLRPSPCDLNDECCISDSPEISPIAWVQCESKCKRWLHQFCVGLLEKGVPKGKYVCSTCKSQGRKRKSLK
ncbi:uncharacterized protein LOC132722215 [Ruditapes philippinarum]|uniref:uncharacterized protein LOC132722215 n=1 Tax=Ruditapes philippinarum TaxID=129788 RepID=UPI00295A6897|nr:uncharacterized protein LOC132722215 [Ruditapes philippinarum]